MLSGFRNFVVRVFAVLAFVMFLGVTVHAQSNTTGAISGTVTDAQKKAIAGASVVARNMATDISTTPVKTDENGRYLISNLVPGRYEIQISADNFAAFKQPDVIVEVGLPTPVGVQMGVAGQTQQVTVSTEAPVVNTEQPDFATNLNKVSVDNLPISSRRWSTFVLLTPGTVPDGTFGDISFRGISGLLNNNTVDGADNNQAFFSEEKGRTRIEYSTSLNSVQEFQVNTADYSAEYGRSAGAVINAVTKSGSNEFHGDAWFYDRDAGLGGARVPFNTGLVQTSPGVFSTQELQPKDVRLQFGGDAGGWLIKNKLFWYFNGDGVTRAFPAVAVPNGAATFFQGITVAAPTGTNPNSTPITCANNFGTFSGNNGSLTGLTNLTIGQQLFCRGISQAQTNTALGFLGSLTGSVPRTGDQTILFPKLDWHINSNNMITLSYNRLRWNSPFGIQTAANVSRGVDSFGNDYVKDDTAVARWSSTWGSHITNELRFTFGRDFEFEFANPAIAGEPVSPLTGLSPQVSINGYSSGLSGGVSFIFGAPTFLQRADYPNETKYQGGDVFSWTVGKNNFKFGFDIYRTGDRISNLFEGLGAYSYSNMADYISDYVGLTAGLNPGGTPATKGLVCQSQPPTVSPNPPPPLVFVPCYSSMTQGFGPAAFNVITYDDSFFGQDDWHVTRRLTLDFGLRWEHESVPVNQNAFSGLPATANMPHDFKDFGPRLGFALDMFGNGKTVLRGGAGLYYGRIINEQLFGVISENANVSSTGTPLSQVTQTVFPTTGSTNSTGTLNPIAPFYASLNPNFTQPFAPATVSTLFFAPDARLPQIYQFDVVLEREISPNTVVSISYIGALGRFLPMGVDTNLPTTGATSLNYTIAGTPPAAEGGQATLSQFPAAGSVFAVPYFQGGNPSRPNQQYQQIIEVSTNARSWYNAGVVQFNRRITHGLQFQVNYTYAHAIDTDQTSSAIFTSNTPLDPSNIGLDRGNSNFDVRHRAVGSLVYQPAFFARGGSNKLAHYLLDGWSIAPIETIQSGLPFSATVSGNAPLTTLGVIGASGSSRVPFIGRNSFRFPDFENTDLRVARTITLKERIKLEVSAEAFNLFNQFDVTSLNTTLFSASGKTLSTAALTYQSTFDTPTAANNSVFYTQRLIQLGARVSF